MTFVDFSVRLLDWVHDPGQFGANQNNQITLDHFFAAFIAFKRWQFTESISGCNML